MVSRTHPQEIFWEHISVPGSAPFRFLFDVSKLFILLVQALSFDQTFVIHNLEIGFLEGQELSNHMDPKQSNNSLGQVRAKVGISEHMCKLLFSKNHSVDITREEKRGKILSPEPLIKVLHNSPTTAIPWFP